MSAMSEMSAIAATLQLRVNGECSCEHHTDCADDGCPAEVPGRNHLSVELGMPFQLHAVGKVIDRSCGSHGDDFLTVEDVRNKRRSCRCR